MATVYVYSPLTSGTIGSVGDGTYCCCPGSSHSPCNGTHGLCVDVLGNAGLTVSLRVNYPNVRSIHITNFTTCAPNCSVPGTHNLVCIDLYSGQNQSECWKGRVAFGHVLNPIYSSGTNLNLSSGTLALGTVPSGTCDPWYTAPHSHMEINGGAVMALICGQSVNSSVAIYKFEICSM